jgi:hypothetical protein
MKVETKAELKDRIATLERRLQHNNGALDSLHKQLIEEKALTKRATIAAYACLAVIAVLVLWEIIL